MLNNHGNYGIYSKLITDNEVYVDLRKANANFINESINNILNILKDGIETQITESLIHITFHDNEQVSLTLVDYFVNLIMWGSILEVHGCINSCHIFFEEDITRKYIAKYIDKHIVIPYRYKMDTKKLNNIICDTLENVKVLDQFSLYLSNTINLENDISLMARNKEAYDIYHTDIDDVPISDVKMYGEESANRLIDIIVNDPEHSLSDFFRAKESINPKQYREYAVNIGTKPDGMGGVYPYRINSNYIVGGLKDIPSLFIESSGGRTAQIISKTNVGTSGDFARLLGLNNSDTILHENPKYICDSKHFQKVYVANMEVLRMMQDRWYREYENGVESLITIDDTHLIGKNILLRSPMTCASKSRGYGICYRCYGPLAFINNDINVGKMAAELLSAILTQMLLSAKHLLESKIVKLNWSPEFYNLFDLNTNIIFLREDEDFGKCKMIIDKDAIGRISAEDDIEYNEHISSFTIIDSAGNEILIKASSENIEENNIYLTSEINTVIRTKGIPLEDEMIEIDMKHLDGIPLFMMKIHNNELSETLDRLTSIINKKNTTTNFDRHELLQEFLYSIIESGINNSLQAIHCEVLLSNQLRDAEDILYDVDWSKSVDQYKVLTLDNALKNNKSIIVALSYRRLNQLLYNPLTFRQDSGRKGSFMDLFFLNSPEKYRNSKGHIKYSNNVVEEI